MRKGLLLRTVFDDEASTSIQDGIPPFVGIYRPVTELSQLIGKSGAAANGTWTLQVQDIWGADSPGHVEAWSIVIAD